ncbi:MAG: methyltransferase domain-containing protein [Acidimicrobiales bacterium]
MSHRQYLHGHHESVLRSHEWRTAENSAGYLLGELRPGMDLLDAGCGPGTVTVDLARRVAPGRVLGVDASAEVVARAAAAATDAGGASVAFAVGDAYALDLDDRSFDVAHAHQLLQHLERPVEALAELRRVLRPGGLLAVRDADYAAFAWSPAHPALDRWLDLYRRLARRAGGEPDAGRHLLGWVQAAGFDEPRATSSTWTFADPASRAWWGGLWADRVLRSAFADRARDQGLAGDHELEAMAGAWRGWAEAPDGWFAVLHGEVLARRPGSPDRPVDPR